MKNLAKLQLETQRSKAKTKPMASARVARAVPQMRKAIKTITGRKDGGAMTKNKAKTYALAERLKDKDRLTKKDIERAEKLTEYFTTNPTEKLKQLKNPKAKDRFAEGRKAKFEKQVERLIKSSPEGSMKDLEKILKRRGGVIRPKPTFKGKVLKPKPIKSRGIGMAIRGFGKAFKKGR